MKIVFDLDGVLRDLNLYLQDWLGIPYPHTWFWKYMGKDIFEWIESDNLFALLNAPPTKYLPTVLSMVDIPELWTCQPNEWKEYTQEWIRKHIGNCTIHYLDNGQKGERLAQETDTLLVEDNPLFKDYSRILLIDQPYNRHIQATRIYKPEELEYYLSRSSNAKTGALRVD